jgi:hypothetical protein
VTKRKQSAALVSRFAQAETTNNWLPYGLRDEKRDDLLDRDIANVTAAMEPGSPEHNDALAFVFSKHLYQTLRAGGPAFQVYHDVEHLIRSLIGCLLNSRTGFGVLMLPHPGTMPDDLMNNQVYLMLADTGEEIEQERAS